MIPEEELKRFSHINLAPMLDFLFLVVALFAILAVTRTALYDEGLHLVKVDQTKSLVPGRESPQRFLVNISVDSEGKYKWITEFNEFIIENTAALQQELRRQQDLGLLPRDTEKTNVLLHIDRNAKWEPIAQLIFAVKALGFPIAPVYDLDGKSY
jgi:biopolymer transport protein ExbD